MFFSALRGKLSQTYENLVVAEEMKNNTIFETNKKLALCYGHSRGLLNYNSILRKEAKNMTMNSAKLLREKRRLTWLLKSNITLTLNTDYKQY